MEALGSDYLSDEDMVYPHGNVRVIDIDTEANKRQDIVDNVKKRFGEDKVLNFCTFSTLASRNAILNACRGLGLDKDLGSYLISLIPRDMKVRN